MSLELKMYGIVPFQLGPLHAGIQFQHAVTLYSRKYNNELYADWADNWMASIILNGGSTNNNENRLGTVNKFYLDCLEKEIDAAAFTEISLGDQITCVAVICDLIKYPDLNFELGAYYDDWLKSIGGKKNLFLRETLRKMPLWK